MRVHPPRRAGAPLLRAAALVFAALGWAAAGAAAAAAAADAAAKAKPILVVGSVNADTTVSLERLPARGECITASKPVPTLAVGGKGANQAVAAARLRAPGAPPPRFVCRFGGDGHGAWMRSELAAAGIDLSGSQTIEGLTSGQGIVWLDAEGAATSVVLGGANAEGWGAAGDGGAPAAAAAAAVRGAGALLLQREVPGGVNLAYAAAAAAAGVPVILDAGGVDSPLEDNGAILGHVDYLAPNEIELTRLTGMRAATLPAARAAAAALVSRGARAVLATLGDKGALLLTTADADGAAAARSGSEGSKRGGGGGGGARRYRELLQPPLPVPGGAVVDATAAGDAFRAAFAVALVEGRGVERALRFAAAAGAVAVSRAGAMPSLPERAEVEALLAAHPGVTAEERFYDEDEIAGGGAGAGTRVATTGGAGGGAGGGADGGQCAADGGRGFCAAPDREDDGGDGDDDEDGTPGGGGGGGGEECPLLFASRLNSMAARPDLAGDGAADDVIAYIARQGRAKGLDLVYFNHPQHLEGRTPQEIRSALDTAGLSAGGVALRFPPRFRAGAFTNPDASLRAAALDLALDACGWARDLGASEVVIWSAFDGYDYSLQADYEVAWARMVQAFGALADRCGSGAEGQSILVSVEWKPTDPSSRFSFLPSTAAALSLAEEVARPNFGLTLDTGHLLMAGENPAQSATMVMAAGRLFGMHLNDGHSRIGAEDGLMFGSVHSAAAQELVYWLRRLGYSGSIYFDTFPLNEDPVAEAAANVRRFKALWARAARLQSRGMDSVLLRHDALASQELLGK